MIIIIPKKSSVGKIRETVNRSFFFHTEIKNTEYQKKKQISGQD